MKNLTIKIRTQKGLILNEMMKQSDRYFLAGDFCGGDPDLPYIGYKAPTRIAEMQKAGLIVSRWSDKKTALGTKLKEYRVNPKMDIFTTADELLIREKLTNTLF